jgi:hypothetical protein
MDGSIEMTSLRYCCCQLTPINPRFPTLRIKLHEREVFRFGRHEDCEQSFPNDFRISGVHAMLLLGSGPDRAPTILVEDSSVNGTFVNGERVPRRSNRTLATGDEIFLVIPNHKLLQQGYTGSLTTNFVGYYFEYLSTLDAAPSIPPLALGDSLSWRRSLKPPEGRDTSTDPPTAVATPRELDAQSPVRQTTDAPSWVHRLPSQTPPHPSPKSEDSGTQDGPSSREESAAPSSVVGAGEAASFTLWWLQHYDPMTLLPNR